MRSEPSSERSEICWPAGAKEMVQRYLSRKWKERYARTLPEDTIRVLAQVILLVSAVSDRVLVRALEDPCYERAYALLEDSRVNRALDHQLIQLFEDNKRKLLTDIQAGTNELRDELLGADLVDFKRLEAGGRLEEADRLLQGKLKVRRNRESAEKYHALHRATNGIKYPIFDLTSELLDVKLSGKPITPQLAFLICNVERLAFSLLQTDEAWQSFPMKWATLRLPVSVVYDLLEEHRSGEDVARYFLQKYQSDEGFHDLDGALGNPVLYHALRRFNDTWKPVVHEAIRCYQNGLYLACVYTSLPLIEGVIWDFADYLDRTGDQIFSSKDPVTAINASSGRIITRPKIRDVVELTRVGEHLDTHFVRHFVDELYEERNIMLHGRFTPEETPLNAARKLAVIEYVVDAVAQTHEERFVQQMDERIDKRLVEGLLDQYEKTKSEIEEAT